MEFSNNKKNVKAEYIPKTFHFALESIIKPLN